MLRGTLNSGLPAWSKPKRRAAILTIAAILSVVAFVLHYHTVFELYVLYLVPMLLVTWFLGLKTGLHLLAVSFIVWTYTDLTLTDTPPWVTLANSIARVGAYALLLWVIDRLRHLNDRLAQLSLTDELTGLPNRRAFLARGELEIKRAGRNKLPLTVMFIDIDDFKTVNDTQGHHAGDALLQQIAQILRRDIRATDLLARLGGDEYAILFPETGAAVARQLAEAIKASAATDLSSQPTTITLSIGVATFDRPAPSFEAALRVADGLMYEAKQAGKNALLHRRLNG